MPDTPGPDAIRTALEKLISSAQLQSSPSLCRFLRYVVEETLGGRGDQIKEYTLGAEVFSRGDNFDPRLDPIVRVQARNLRARMAKYYEGPGSDEPVIIDLPKRRYVPVFVARDAAEQPAPPAAGNEARRATKRGKTRVVAAAVAIAACGAALSWPLDRGDAARAGLREHQRQPGVKELVEKMHFAG